LHLRILQAAIRIPLGAPRVLMLSTAYSEQVGWYLHARGSAGDIHRW
jgi:hypothetical protein